jgi:hypothetical protein
MTGDSGLTTSQAADQVKRLLNFFPDATASLLEDPLLAEAFEKAVRLRPQRPKRGSAKETPD